ncbi:YrrC family ATP-dependent DNA helicase [Thiocystis minor]|uniref:YrrC family ATP-dependent DNA helicase n=1 Tax=Thiocystis minor TaxID=61597 RepID=UPI003B82DA68
MLRVKVPGAHDLVTVIGSAASVAPGESLNAEGAWHNDRQHGLKANDLRQVPPSTAEGIERSLGSGMVKGIGPHFAKTWVRAFGDVVFEIIEQHPERLLELAGIFGALTNSFTATGWEAVRPRQPRCTRTCAPMACDPGRSAPTPLSTPPRRVMEMMN